MIYTDFIPEKRITVISGHYGSGKTSAAVSFAENIAHAGKKVALADLDTVNPYFRTKDYAGELKSRGIRVIVSDYANTNVDMPALPGEIYSVFSYPDEKIIIDLGGDDRGALAIGRLRDGILDSHDYEMLFTVNFRRPLTSNVADALDVLLETQSAAGIAITGLLNCTNLGDETDENVIKEGIALAREMSQKTGIPVYANCVTEHLYAKFRDSAERCFPVSRR